MSEQDSTVYDPAPEAAPETEAAPDAAEETGEDAPAGDGEATEAAPDGNA